MWLAKNLWCRRLPPQCTLEVYVGEEKRVGRGAERAEHAVRNVSQPDGRINAEARVELLSRAWSSTRRMFKRWRSQLWSF